MSWLRVLSALKPRNIPLHSTSAISTHNLARTGARGATNHLGSRRHFSRTSFLSTDNGSPPAFRSPPTQSASPLTEKSSSEPRMAIAFTCTVVGCGERSAHHFTKRSYERGIVIVQCPKCKNRHLIADHLGWFKESTQDGKLKTVEDLLREKGERVTRGSLDFKGVLEYNE